MQDQGPILTGHTRYIWVQSTTVMVYIMTHQLPEIPSENTVPTIHLQWDYM